MTPDRIRYLFAHARYYPALLEMHKGRSWDYESRDVNPGLFLEDMFTAYPRSGHFVEPVQCKAVGFKSFPEHWQERRMANSILEELFTSLMTDVGVKKIILHRRDVIRVYLSAQRAKATGAYMMRNNDDVLIHIDVPELQAYIDRYRAAYRLYSRSVYGQNAVFVAYEGLLAEEQSDEHTSMRRILTYSGCLVV